MAWTNYMKQFTDRWPEPWAVRCALPYRPSSMCSRMYVADCNVWKYIFSNFDGNTWVDVFVKGRQQGNGPKGKVSLGIN